MPIAVLVATLAKILMTLFGNALPIAVGWTLVTHQQEAAQLVSGAGTAAQGAGQLAQGAGAAAKGIGEGVGQLGKTSPLVWVAVGLAVLVLLKK